MSSADLYVNGTLNCQKALYPATPTNARQTNAAIYTGSGLPPIGMVPMATSTSVLMATLALGSGIV